jgi:hypothetical protein
MQKTLLIISTVFFSLFTQAQNIAEVKGILFYEHHSTDMTGMGFGSSANGSKSGYDFVKRTYANSFDPNTNGPFTKGEEKDLDMVEHNGPFGTNGSQYSLGFTSGVSTIWTGDIQGNGITKWHKVVVGIAGYDNLKNYIDLKSFYDSTKATVNIEIVQKDDVFIGKIRNTDLYVMLKCTKVVVPRAPITGGDGNDYFEFDYKFGSKNGVTAVQEFSANSIKIYPNPTSNLLSVDNQSGLSYQTVQLRDVTGKQISLSNTQISQSSTELSIQVSHLSEGLYTLILMDTEGKTYTHQFLKTN